MRAYRSDWPEIGLGGPFAQASELALPISARADWSCAAHDVSGGLTVALRGVRNTFETEFYGFLCLELRMEALCPGDATNVLESPSLQERLKDLLLSSTSKLSAEQAYVYAKVLVGEPLHMALTGAGFEAVEHRRLYRCNVGDLASGASSEAASEVDYLTLAQALRNPDGGYPQQILDICKESFQTGHSRHFRDAHLSQRQSGTEYILALMRRNLEHVAADGFLLAIDHHTGELLGFTVVGRKSGLQESTYTQLLSGVRSRCRGRNIYRGLTRLLADTFPKDAALLNVTHVQAEAIQVAYRDTGRVHLADTVVVRRVFGPAN